MPEPEKLDADSLAFERDLYEVGMRHHLKGPALVRFVREQLALNGLELVPEPYLPPEGLRPPEE